MMLRARSPSVRSFPQPKRIARHASCAGGLRSARVRADLVEVLMFGRALVSPARAKLLEERALCMRGNPTRSEEWLWRRLSGSKTGFAFRRQLVIGEHIVDFACTKVRLVVEVDGAYHEERARHDAARARAQQAWLAHPAGR